MSSLQRQLQLSEQEQPLLLEEQAEVDTFTHVSHDDCSSTYSRTAVALVFGVPALGGFLFGYDISVTSYAIVQLETSTAIVIQTNNALQGLIVASASLGALAGSVLILYVADRMGRRSELRYGALFYLLGAALEIVAGVHVVSSTTSTVTTTWLAIAVLIMGRLVYGLGIAFSMHGGPTYIAEMAPSSIRGLLVSLKEAVIVLGILSGYVIGYFALATTTTTTTTTPATGWMLAYGSTMVVSTIMLALSYTIPRSCRWLLLQEKEEEALESVRFVFTEVRAMQEFEAMMAQQRFADDRESRERTATRADQSQGITTIPAADATMRSNEKTIWDVEYRAPLTAGLGLVILQQITGQPSILSYAAPIFKQAGLSDSASILVAVFKLVATLSAAATVERYGRKTLLYSGITLMLLALLALTFTAFGSEAKEGSSVGSSNNSNAWILTAMFVYIGGYQFSFGPISWLMISEVFPLAVRGQAVAVAVQMNFLFNAVVQFVVPVLERMIGLNAMFGIFALLTAYSIYFVKANVRETKGLNLEQIEQQFREMRSRGNDEEPLLHVEVARQAFV